MHCRSVDDALGAVDGAVAWADALAAEADAPQDARFNLQVCLEEVLANLVLHARRRDGREKAIALGVTASPDAIFARVTDHCQPFDLTLAPLPEAPTPDDMRIGGQGMRLVRAFAEKLDYAAEGERNRLDLLITGPAAAVTTAELRAAAALAECEEATLAMLLESGAPCWFSPGESLLREGGIGDCAYVLLSGRAVVSTHGPEGESILARPTAPDLVGAIGGVAGLQRTASVTAETPVRALRLEREVLLRACQADPGVLAAITRQVGQQINTLNPAIGLYAKGLSALEAGDFDPSLVEALVRPNPALAHFSEAFARLAKKLHEERRAREEMANAAAMQRAMLPSDLDGLDSEGRLALAAAITPARDIGGDFFDAFMLAPDWLFVAIGDVCGKGVPASLYMAQTVTTLRMAAKVEPRPERMIALADELLSADNPNLMFATLFCGVLHLPTGRFSYVNGGHPPALRLTADGRVRALRASGAALGLGAPNRRRARRAVLGPGESIVLFTDGVTEAPLARGGDYGLNRLRRLLRANAGAEPAGLIAAIEADVAAASAGEERFDDLTLLVLRRPPA
jgi:phosphoserine phosphatase RsbU/P